MEEIFEKIDKIFLLTPKEKQELKNYLQTSPNKLKIILEEKNFINNYLKTLLQENTKDMTYIEIHNTMKQKYLKQIKILEQQEQENINKILDNI